MAQQDVNMSPIARRGEQANWNSLTDAEKLNVREAQWTEVHDAIELSLRKAIEKPRMLMQDAGGALVLGLGSDMITRGILWRLIHMRPGEDDISFHQRWDRTSGYLSMGMGAAKWMFAIFTNQDSPMKPIHSALRTGGSTEFILGLNRFCSSYTKLPA